MSCHRATASRPANDVSHDSTAGSPIGGENDWTLQVVLLAGWVAEEAPSASKMRFLLGSVGDVNHRSDRAIEHSPANSKNLFASAALPSPSPRFAGTCETVKGVQAAGLDVERRGIAPKLLSLGAVGAFARSWLTTFKSQAFRPPRTHSTLYSPVQYFDLLLCRISKHFTRLLHREALFATRTYCPRSLSLASPRAAPGRDEAHLPEPKEPSLTHSPAVYTISHLRPSSALEDSILKYPH